MPYDVTNTLSYIVRHHMGCKERGTAASPDPRLEWATKGQQQIGAHVVVRGFLAKAWYEVMVERGTDKPGQKMARIQSLV